MGKKEQKKQFQYPLVNYDHLYEEFCAILNRTTEFFESLLELLQHSFEQLLYPLVGL